MIRFLDILLSGIGLIVLSPFFLIIGIWVKLDSKGPVFFTQQRVGKNFELFSLYKFRTMKVNAEKAGLLTVGKDPRITPSGYFLRKYKLDELPQLFNVLKGDMSMVGPRPEVKKYVDQYNSEQEKLLSIRPGITDPASIYYNNESAILGRSSNPERDYLQIILPHKLKLSQSYVKNRSLISYFKYIFLTLAKMVGLIK